MSDANNDWRAAARATANRYYRLANEARAKMMVTSSVSREANAIDMVILSRVAEAFEKFASTSEPN